MATKRFNFKFHCAKDSDIIARLSSVDNMQDYIRSLIRADIFADNIRLQVIDRNSQTWEDYYQEHCPTINNPEEFANGCEGCPYLEVYGCSLDEHYRKEVLQNGKSTN